LGRNKKVEQHIRKKTNKPNVLKFWVEGGVIPLYGFGSALIVRDLPGCFFSRILSASGIRADGFRLGVSTVLTLYQIRPTNLMS